MANGLQGLGYSPFTPSAVGSNTFESAARNLMEAFRQLDAERQRRAQEAAQVSAVNAPGVQALLGMLSPAPQAPISGGVAPAPLASEALLTAQRVAPGLNLAPGPAPSPVSGAVPPAPSPNLAQVLGLTPSPSPRAVAPAPSPGVGTGGGGAPPRAAPFAVGTPAEADLLLRLAPQAFNLQATREAQTTKRDVTEATLAARARAAEGRLAKGMLDILQKQADNRTRLAAVRASLGRAGAGTPLDYRAAKDLLVQTGQQLRTIRSLQEQAKLFDAPPEQVAMLDQQLREAQVAYDEAYAAVQRFAPNRGKEAPPPRDAIKARLETLSDEELEALAGGKR